MTPIYQDIPPSLLGLPGKFGAFRTAQAEAIGYAVYDSTKPVTAMGLATGAGKSLIAVATARAMDTKLVYLTATKALQEQILDDFRSCGMVDVRGRANYQCPRYGNCADGKDEECGHPYCPSDAAVAQAQQARTVVTNYAWWMHNRRGPEAIDGVGLLVMDEVAEAPEIVAEFVAPRVEWEEIGRKPLATDPDGLTPDGRWEDVLEHAQARVKGQIEAAREDKDRKRARKLALLAERLAVAERASRSPGWVWQADRYKVRFTPLWPGPYAPAALWQGIPRVIMMSATIRPYTLRLLGLDRAQYDFREWPVVFLPQHGPVYHHSSGVRLNHRSTGEDYMKVVDLMDRWIEARPGRRVIVHAGSYERAKRIADMSAFHRRFIVNDGAGDSMRAAEELRRSEAGILCSPSFVAGWDFPGRACELVLIPKVPWPNTTDRVMSERCKADEEYRFYSAVQDVVQGAGRARRYAGDRCETVIFDDAVRWLQGGPRMPWRGHAPGWFRVQTVREIPPAPPRPEAI